jgi:hypothetical protein
MEVTGTATAGDSNIAMTGTTIGIATEIAGASMTATTAIGNSL